jgi:hypothetical protein
MPPLTALSSLLIERTSFRSSFFSDAVRSDLSDVLISFSLSSNSLALAASAGLTGLVLANEEGSVLGAALNESGINVNDNNVAIKQRANFFMIPDLFYYDFGVIIKYQSGFNIHKITRVKLRLFTWKIVTRFWVLIT